MGMAETGNIHATASDNRRDLNELTREPESNGAGECVNEETVEYSRFFKVFFMTKGAPQLLILSLLVSIGVGSTIGVVPDVVSDRYARLNHHYSGIHCSSFDRADKPDACQLGADDAQASAALATLLQNMITLVSNSTIGSISDASGRRWVMVFSAFLSTIAPCVLVLMQLVESVDPAWFYVATSATGLVNWMSIAFAMLSDIIRPGYRALGFGLFLSSFYLGFAISPSFPLLMDHFEVSILSMSLLVMAFLFSVIALPETLPPEVSEQNLLERAVMLPESNWYACSILRPIREMSILNRDSFIRLLAVGAFFSGMVYSSDQSLVLYYIEDQLDVRDTDLARMFFIMGIVGVVVQGLLLQLLVAWLGEKGLLVTSFVSGTFHNLLYGLARSKSTIYVALCLSQLTKTNFPLTSSLASNNVNASEQGRMQGALFALSALANAVGPVTLEFIYKRTKDGGAFGPGTMFVFASFLYAVGTVMVSFLDADKANAKPAGGDKEGSNSDENKLDEPLLQPPLQNEV